MGGVGFRVLGLGFRSLGSNLGMFLNLNAGSWPYPFRLVHHTLNLRLTPFRHHVPGSRQPGLEIRVRDLGIDSEPMSNPALFQGSKLLKTSA